MSIKGEEREKRSTSGQLQITASRQDLAAPMQFEKYFSIGANKTDLPQNLLNDS